MPTVSAQFLFDIEPNPVCWTGLPSHFELRLLQPLPIYALEQLRQRFLYAVTTGHNPIRSARAVAQMAFETEIGTAIAKLVQLPPDVFTSLVCDRRRYIEIDNDMAAFSFLFAPALDGVRQAGYLPESYVRLFEEHLKKPYAKYRVCDIAALLCISAFYLVPEVVQNFERAFNDAVVTADHATAVPGFVRVAHDFVATADGFNVIPHHVIQDSVSVVDRVGYGRSKYEPDIITTSDQAQVVVTQIAYWRLQTSPEILPLDMRRPNGIYGVDDFEIYAVGGGGGGGTSHVWKWNGTVWSALTFGNTGAIRVWCNHDGTKVFVFANGGVYESTNHGVSFLPKPWPFVYTGGAFFGVEDFGTGLCTLYAAYNQGGVGRSTDDGSTWTTILPQNYGGGTSADACWAFDKDNVFIGGNRSNAFLVHIDSAGTITDLTTKVDFQLGNIYAIWGTSPLNVYVGGYRFGGGNVIMHTTDGFATPAQIESMDQYGGAINNADGISGVDENEVYATVVHGSEMRVQHAFQQIDGPDVWRDDAAVPTAPTAAQLESIWVNPATGRGVVLADTGVLQTNKNPAPGRATSPRKKFGPDIVTCTDTVKVVVGHVVSKADTVTAVDTHS